MIDASTGKSIISGKTITGFTTEGEQVMGILGTVKSWGEPLVEELAVKLGAKCKNISSFLPRISTIVKLTFKTDERPPGVWDSFHVTDGRLVTGTNPASAKEAAEAAVKAFEAL